MSELSEDRRRRRAPQALARLSDRHARTEAMRARSTSRAVAEPRDVVRLVELLGAGTAARTGSEDEVDADDLVDALTLVPLLRAELDETELGLMTMARGRGLTWVRVAEALGLQTAQAAQQRFERLTRRTVEP